MKKYFLLFAAGGILTLASCGGEATPTETINVDSLAQVKVDSMAAIEKAKSDSTLLATAQTTADSLMQVMREDSIAAAAAKAAGKKVPAKKVVVTKSTATEVVATPEPPKSDKENKLDKMRGNATEKTQEEIQKSQDAKSSKLDKMRGK
ncbi:MAG: hypothetical protein IT256_09530 [Chitinophagaceae bacterium]|nr:hypothetical protein [Chitinophagaceae bacterium]